MNQVDAFTVHQTDVNRTVLRRVVDATREHLMEHHDDYDVDCCGVQDSLDGVDRVYLIALLNSALCLLARQPAPAAHDAVLDGLDFASGCAE